MYLSKWNHNLNHIDNINNDNSDDDDIYDVTYNWMICIISKVLFFIVNSNVRTAIAGLWCDGREKRHPSDRENTILCGLYHQVYECHTAGYITART